MSGLPPQLNTETGTPASEWARSTTTTAFAHGEPAPASAPEEHTTTTVRETPGATIIRDVPASATTRSITEPPPIETPDGEVPGAYPTPGATRNNLDVADAAGKAAATASVVAEGLTNVASAAATQAANAANYVSENASQYFPSSLGGATEKVSQNLPSSVSEATEKAAQQLPSSVSNTITTSETATASEHDAAHVKSLPSSERSGKGEYEHVGGAGALPGTVSEEGVSALPDEKNRELDSIGGYAASTSATGKPDSINIAGSYPPRPYVDTAVAGAAFASGTYQATSLPSQEKTGNQPGEHQGGIGALPGNVGERGVAVPPDERRINAGFETRPTQETLGNEGLRDGQPANVPGVGNLVGDQNEENVASLPDERSEKDGGKPAQGVTGKAKEAVQETKEAAKDTAKKVVPGKTSKQGNGEHEKLTAESDGDMQADLLHPTLSPRVHPLGWSDAQWMGTCVGEPYKDGDGVDLERMEELDSDTDYHPAQLHPPTDNGTKGEVHDTAPGASVAAATANPQHDTGAAPRDADKTKKTGFMSKMKGEAKILLGKVEGKKGQDKVEEGKRLKGDA